MPGVLTGLGIGTLFTTLGLQTNWLTSGLGAHLTWTLPFGLLIMFAVLNRFDGSWEEAARDAGASRKQVLKQVTLSILFPGLIAVALFDLTLSYDELPRALLTVGTKNTLPLQMASLTTALSLVVIAVAFAAIALTGRKR